MKTLYVVNYWVPFPSSVYGGLVVVIAESDDEACALLAPMDARYSHLIPKAVVDARRVPVDDEQRSEILSEFTT
jgi:hypothetical protein